MFKFILFCIFSLIILSFFKLIYSIFYMPQSQTKNTQITSDVIQLQNLIIDSLKTIGLFQFFDYTIKIIDIDKTNSLIKIILLNKYSISHIGYTISQIKSNKWICINENIGTNINSIYETNYFTFSHIKKQHLCTINLEQNFKFFDIISKNLKKGYNYSKHK